MSATGGIVTVSSDTMSNSQFAISGVSFPLTIGAGQSVPFSVIFSPTVTGAVSGTLTLTSNASNGKTTQSLAGIGTAQTYNVALSWTPSTSQVAGYNVYRGLSVGAYSKINTSLDPGTTYNDTTVVAGVTYYYAATAVNSAGQESSYSSPIEVAIP
jgi:fibronectin type 3 domain-containing protein